MKLKVHFSLLPSFDSHPAFSRIDLVATVGCVGVLSVLTAASIAATGSGSHTAACLNNLRTLIRAWQHFDADRGFLPPNPDDGNTIPGKNWVPGEAGRGQAQEFNPDILMDTNRSLLAPYLTDASVFRCPDDVRSGKYQGSDIAKKGQVVPAARSYSMNQAIGADPYATVPGTPPNGPWLDNQHAHVRYSQWRTYGKLNDMIDPSPAGLAVLLDEDADSLNDGGFAFGMARAEWIDWPGTRHDTGAVMAFADGHAELFTWTDSRTVVRNGNVALKEVPGSVDYSKLRSHISAALPLNNPRVVVWSPPFHPADVKVVWPVTGSAYRAEFSDDLNDLTSLAPLSIQQGEARVIDPAPPGSGKRFYRLLNQ